MTKTEATKLLDAIHKEIDGLIDRNTKKETHLLIGAVESIAYAEVFNIVEMETKKMIEDEEEKCPGCGKTFEDEMPKFCPDCGRKLKKE